MPIPRDLIENVHNLAARQADIIAVQDGTKVQLEETPHLQLPFLFPQDGFVVGKFRDLVFFTFSTNLFARELFCCLLVACWEVLSRRRSTLNLQ